MRIKVLGASGGEAPGQHLTGFLIGQDCLLDAGTAGSRLSLEEQREIRHVLLTHAHLDHIHALPFLLDNLIGRVAGPVQVYSAPEILEAVHQHLFNDKIWPDFTRLPSVDQPILVFRPVGPHQAFQAGSLTVEAIPVDHSFSAYAYIIGDGSGHVIFTGDTGPTDALWARADALTDLKAIFMECSFSREQKGMATLTHHLATSDLAEELAKMKKGLSVPVFLYHLKPAYAETIFAESRALRPLNVRVPEPGLVLNF